MIFCDASVLLAAEDTDDANYASAVALLELGVQLATIDLAVYEVTNVAVSRWRDRKAAGRLRDRVFAIAQYGQLVHVDREIIEDAVAIAESHGISVYDAAYAAGAAKVGAPLASCDLRELVSRELAVLPRSLVNGDQQV